MASIFCKKLKAEGEALECAPIPGEIGQRILQEISSQAWQLWLEHQTIIINEYKLSLANKAAKDFLREEMIKFLFEDKDVISGFPPKSSN